MTRKAMRYTVTITIADETELRLEDALETALEAVRDGKTEGTIVEEKYYGRTFMEIRIGASTPTTI